MNRKYRERLGGCLIEILLRNLVKEVEENRKTPQTPWSMSRSGLELSISRIRV